MVQKIISQGAEAKIFLDKKLQIVTKDRISKLYRIKEIDDSIRKRRTKSEEKLLIKASKFINVPIPTQDKKNSYTIKMSFVEGKKLSQNLDKLPLKKQLEICKMIGEDLSKLHNENIIHGDLTTSNLILKDKKIFFIDFGLGYFNGKYEDKAVDLHLFKQALEAKHFKNFDKLYLSFEKAYKKNAKSSETILQRLKAVERRGRYRH